jgi:two-component system, NarL family, nitrate/nitrite response regulator NarL
MNESEEERALGSAPRHVLHGEKAVARLELSNFPCGEAQIVGMVPEPVSKMIRVLIMSNHAITRMGLRLIMEKQPGIKIVEEAKGHADGLAADGEQPDVILFDLDSFNGSDFLTRALETVNGAGLLILTSTDDSNVDQYVLHLGAMGIVHKDKPAEVLVKAIERIYAGEIWLDRLKLSRALREILPTKRAKTRNGDAVSIATLTRREREVVALIGEGLNTRHLAKRLFISETTVRHHLTSIFDKLWVSSCFELVFYAYHHGLATPPRFASSSSSNTRER